MRARLVPIPLVALLAFGCARSEAPAGLQPGDTVRPEISFAPKEPWHTGDRIAVGVLLRVERAGGEGHYLQDKDVVIERAEMGSWITFLNGEQIVGDPLAVPLVHDC